jgi:hypothetical protein
MEIHPMETALFQADQYKNGRTDMTKPIVAFRNFVNAPKNYLDI